MTMTELKRTALYDIHAARGARFVSFAGFEMPVQYAGVIAEHTAVRENVGLFDVSHMGEVIVEGCDALVGLQRIVTNDLSKLQDGDALYTVMCHEDGGIVDDLIVYRESAERYFICVNASRREDDYNHMLENLHGLDCAAMDVSEDYAQIALQGPKAAQVLAAVSDIDLAAMKSFSWVDTAVGGIENVRVACTGYTGESGVEFYLAPSSARALWQALEAAGEAHGIASCGLGARDTLRLEMKYALYGNDIDEKTNPYEAGLGWVVKLKKGEFCGSSALADIKARGPKMKLVGFKMKSRGIPRPGYDVQFQGNVVGRVTSGTHSPSLGEAIGLAYVPAEMARVGSEFEILIRTKTVAAVVVKTPFYKREEA